MTQSKESAIFATKMVLFFAALLATPFLFVSLLWGVFKYIQLMKQYTDYLF